MNGMNEAENGSHVSSAEGRKKVEMALNNVIETLRQCVIVLEDFQNQTVFDDYLYPILFF
jgi:hypothetical protein